MDIRICEANQHGDGVMRGDTEIVQAQGGAHSDSGPGKRYRAPSIDPARWSASSGAVGLPGLRAAALLQRDGWDRPVRPVLF